MTGWTLCIGYGSSDLFVILVHYKLHLSPSFVCYTYMHYTTCHPLSFPCLITLLESVTMGISKELSSSSSSSWMMAHCQCHSLLKVPTKWGDKHNPCSFHSLVQNWGYVFTFLVAFLHVSSTNTNSQMFHLPIYLWFKLVDSLEAHVGWCHPILEADMDCLSDTYLYLTCTLLPFFLHPYVYNQWLAMMTIPTSCIHFRYYNYSYWRYMMVSLGCLNIRTWIILDTQLL